MVYFRLLLTRDGCVASPPEAREKKPADAGFFIYESVSFDYSISHRQTGAELLSRFKGLWVAPQRQEWL